MLYWDAFRDLATCRQIGMAPGPIPWTAILAYCNEHGIHGEIREEMFTLIRALDDAYLDHVAKEQKRHSSKKTHGRR